MAYAGSHQGYGEGYSRRVVEVDLPWRASGQRAALRVEELVPPSAASKLPAVVLLHGYLASPGMLDRLYAEELAGRGFVVQVPRGFMDAGVACISDCRTLQARVAPILAVVDRLRRDPRIDPDRIGLLGHSYGSSLAMETACADWRVAATVAMAGSLQSLDYVNHACPRNLLLLHGDADRFTADRHQGFVLEKATRGMLRSADEIRGDLRRGDARLLKIIGGAGHLTILGATEARQLAVDWLEASLAPGRHPRPVRPLPLGWIVVGLLATLILTESVAATILGRRAVPRPTPPRWTRIVVGALGLLAVPWAAIAAAPYTFGRLQPALGLAQIGGEVLVATSVLIAAAVLPVIAGSVWWMFGGFRRGLEVWWRPFAAAAARLVLLYCCLRLLFAGYYDPAPGGVHLLSAARWLPVLLAALGLVSAAASTLDESFAAIPLARALRLPRLALAGAVLFALVPLADRYNDVVAPAIHLVPFHLATAVVLVAITCGPTGETALSRALFAASIALWLLALVFPLDLPAA